MGRSRAHQWSFSRETIPRFGKLLLKPLYAELGLVPGPRVGPRPGPALLQPVWAIRFGSAPARLLG